MEKSHEYFKGWKKIEKYPIIEGHEFPYWKHTMGA